MKKTVFIYHDESTVHAKEQAAKTWLLPGTSELRSKNAVRLIHTSDFILETTGRLVISPKKLKELQQTDSQNLPESEDAVTVI